MSILQKNINSLFEYNPILATKLHSIRTNEQFEVFMDEKDVININLFDKKHNKPFYETKPIDEITNRYNEIMDIKSRYPFLVFYGISNGLLIKMFTNIDKFVLVIEPNLELIYIALSLFDFSQEIKKKKLSIILEEDLDFSTLNTILSNPDIKTFLKTYEIEINHTYYLELYKDNIIHINKEIVNQISHIITSEGNSAEDSLIGLNHHLQNIPKMLKSYTLESLVKNVNTKTAVIVSTGPSLAKQLPLLKQYQKYITILCIDASLPILQKEGIVPDIVFSLERVEATAKFYENLDKELLKDTIFAPTSISHPKLLENIKGFRQAINMRPFSYTRMFKTGKWGYIGIGMSAANMAFDFAFMAKFENVVLIGQDLAFGKDGKTHSKGAIYGEVEEQYKKKKVFKIKGYYGDEVLTSGTWKLFLNFFIRDVPEFIKKGVNVYNCTEGGAYIDGANHIPFKEFLERLDTSKEKNIIQCQKVNENKQLHYINRVKKLTSLYIERLKWIKSETEKVFLEVMEKIENLEKLNKDDDLEKIDFDELTATISKIDKIKDILETDKVLMKFNNITNPLIVSAELELAKIMVRNSETDIEKKVKLIDWIYEHKSWLFFLAGAIENIIFIMEKNLKEVYL